MPWTWIEPRALAVINGETVYHAYKHPDFVMQYHYQIWDDEDGWMAFDVRALAAWAGVKAETHQQLLEEIVKATGGSLADALKASALWYEGEA